MRWWPGPGLVLIPVALALAAGDAGAATTDCRRATAFVDKAVCRSPDLLALDRELADTLRERLGGAPNGRARDALSAEQRRWNAARALACPPSAPGAEAAAEEQAHECLGRIYAQRVAVLARERMEARWPKLPFRPVMLEGAGRPLCEGLYRDVLASFFGPAARINPLGEREVGFRAVTLGRPAEPDAKPPAIALADPHRTGRDQAVLRLESAPTDRRAGTWTYRLFPSEDALRRAFRVSPTGAPNPFAVDGDRDLSQPLFDPEHFAREREASAEPRPLLDQPRLSVQAAPRLFQAEGRTLALIPLASGAGDASLLGVYAFSGPTRAERLCLFEIERPPAPEDQLAALGEVEVLRQAANALLPPPACGPRDEDAGTIEVRAVTRPWSLRPVPASDRLPRRAGTEEVRLFLQRKATTGIEARRSVAAFEEAYAEAEARVARVYREAFGRADPEARALARLYLDRVLADGVPVSEDGPVRSLLGRDAEARQVLRAAAMTGDAPAVLGRLGPDPKAAIAAAQGSADEPLLSVSLDHPDLVRALLERGADPNAYGASGFTPLMSAARLGLTEAARILVAGGADPDLLSRPARFEARILGADPCAEAARTGSEAGLTALLLAESGGSAEIAELLEPLTRARPATR